MNDSKTQASYHPASANPEGPPYTASLDTTATEPRAWYDVSSKVTASALGAALATVIVYAIEAPTGLDIPVTVEGAGALIVAFLLGYFVPDNR